ncbi:high-affinity Zn(2+) transporter zrt1 [Tulasnella sp. 330]|nr:high-affinity Zn(2+) transporter zrt1 [Tulasnella sp. 330]KAG8880093.1 high-affinity Zn(2+) transporter zrt1 [Tulasnella sp. 331]
MSDLQCGSLNNQSDFLGLRIGSIFVILASSCFGALFPVIAKRATMLPLPKAVYDFAKYFGSGVIIATAFIHLLAPAFDELGSACLGGAWTTYPWASAIAMFSVFSVFFIELFAFRWGMTRLEATKAHYDPHGHGLAGGAGHHSAHGPEMGAQNSGGSATTSDPNITKHEEANSGVPTGVVDVEAHGHVHELYATAAAQIIGVSILEFGVVFHSLLVGMTLAVSTEFKVLFVVLVFHQMFEGLGLGSRLAFLDLPPAYNWARYAGACAFGFTTPLGIVIGLGIRASYNPNSTTASIVSGCFDATSAGILLYTGLVELLAHEFIFNPEFHKTPVKKLLYPLICMVCGAALMSLLGRWA